MDIPETTEETTSHQAHPAMTLIVSLATERFVLQVGDTRVSYVLPGGLTRTADDHRNKLVYFDGRIAFGYTGLAMLQGTSTDKWIAHQLTRQSFSDDLAPLSRLAEQATLALSKTAGYRRLAIVGVGWHSATNDARKPGIWRVSNFHDKEDVLAGTLPAFRMDAWKPAEFNGAWKLVTHGACPPRNLRRNLEVYIRRLTKKRHPPVDFARALAGFVRDCSKSEKTIGTHLVSIYLPANPDKKVIRMIDGRGSVGLAMHTYAGTITTVVLGGGFDTTACFHYWPGDGSEPKVLTPCIAGRDLMIEDISAIPTTRPSPPPS